MKYKIPDIAKLMFADQQARADKLKRMQRALDFKPITLNTSLGPTFQNLSIKESSTEIFKALLTVYTHIDNDKIMSVIAGYAEDEMTNSNQESEPAPTGTSTSVTDDYSDMPALEDAFPDEAVHQHQVSSQTDEVKCRF